MRIGIGMSIVGQQGIPVTGLLDEYGGAAAAYSLRSLSSSSTIVVRVRRDGDQEEADFTASQVSGGALTSWVVAGGGTEDGHVVTWYDQAGSNDATQATADSQPKIVSGGALVTVNGKVAISWDGSNDYLQASITGFQSITNLSTFTVVTPTNAAAADTGTMTAYGFGKLGGSFIAGLSLASSSVLVSGEKILIFFEDNTDRRIASSIYSRSANEQSLLTLNHLQSGTTLFSQGSQVTLDVASGMTASTPASPSDTGYTDDDNVQIGALYSDSTGAVTAYAPERFQEIIFYASDQSANRTGIEANINAYYSIYP